MKIAIDGPAGAGKSTMARTLAAKLGYLYIDTGAMYRALALKALRATLNLNDPQELLDLALHTQICFEPDHQQQKVICDGLDVTEAIRSPEVSSVVSQVAAHPDLRNKWSSCSVIWPVTILWSWMVGISGVCFADADYKFYVTASLQERAQRRIRELQAKGYEVNEEEIKNDIENRDYKDSHREVGALKILPDSIIIDTSDLTIEEAVAKILSFIEGAQK